MGSTPARPTKVFKGSGAILGPFSLCDRLESSRVRRPAAARLSCRASPAVGLFDFDHQIDLIGLLSPAPTNSTVALCFVHQFFKELRRVETSAAAAVIRIACLSGAQAAPSMTVNDLGIVAGPATKSTSAASASSEDHFNFFVGPDSNAMHASAAGNCRNNSAFLPSVAPDRVASWATSGLDGLAPITSRLALRSDPAQGTLVYTIATDTCRLRPSAAHNRARSTVSAHALCVTPLSRGRPRCPSLTPLHCCLPSGRQRIFRTSTVAYAVQLSAQSTHGTRWLRLHQNRADRNVGRAFHFLLGTRLFFSEPPDRICARDV